MDLAFFLLWLAPGGSFLLGLYLGSWYLRRNVRELTYAVADLEDRLIREVKKRAASSRWEGEADLTKELTNSYQAQAPDPKLDRQEFIRRKWGGRMKGGPREIS